MKHVVTVLWQIGLFLIAALVGFVAGMVSPAIRVQHVVSRAATHIRTYDFNWIIAVVLVYAILLLVGAARKRLRHTFITSTIALVLTVAGLAFLTQIGYRDVSIY